ncbi:MAG: HAMP domain-containing sensor histidine kinase, partial [Candidatus Saccharimonadales bacterium]
PDSTVRLVTFRKRQMVGFKVINEGKGIDTASLPHIFDRFYRTDRARTGTSANSYGLGLALAKKIVELYGGDLSVSSAPNALTTFTVSLPLHTKKSSKKITKTPQKTEVTD